MHIHTLEPWQHSHDFSSDRQDAEKNTKTVMIFAAIAMVGEIVAGLAFGSMALLADGWHMATHVAAFGITVFAYQYARRHANNPQYTFGTGKVGVLGGFTSAVALAVVALVMVLESIGRLFQHPTIQFDEAIVVAIIGLAVNLVSALLLHDEDHHHHHNHHHHHDHHHDEARAYSHAYHHDHAAGHHDHGHHDHADEHHDHEHHDHEHHDHAHEHDDRPLETASPQPQRHRDQNLKAAYLHVLADALTSVLAIVALVAGKFWGWIWLDAVMGMVGAVAIGRWAYGLATETSSILLDGAVESPIKLAIVSAIEAEADNRITDLHVWYLSENHVAATIAVVTHHPQEPDHYKRLLDRVPALSHVIVEVNPCHRSPCLG